MKHFHYTVWNAKVPFEKGKINHDIKDPDNIPNDCDSAII